MTYVDRLTRLVGFYQRRHAGAANAMGDDGTSLFEKAFAPGADDGRSFIQHGLWAVGGVHGRIVARLRLACTQISTQLCKMNVK